MPWVRCWAAGSAMRASRCVIEEFMAGEEASLFVLTDGHTILPFGTAQDHKRAFDGDRGPNTGGMGAYSPAAILTAQLEQQAMEQIIIPTIRLLAAESTPYSGVLYAGLMLTSEGPKLVEYNCRLWGPGMPGAHAALRRRSCPRRCSPVRQARWRNCRRRASHASRRSQWCWRRAAIRRHR